MYEENVEIMENQEILENQNENQEDYEYEGTTDMTIPDDYDIEEAEKRCMRQPVVALIVGGVAVGAAIGVGVTKLVKTVKRKKDERKAAKEADKDIDDKEVIDVEPEEIEDPHPEVPSEDAKELLKPESQRKRRKSQRKIG